MCCVTFAVNDFKRIKKSLHIYTAKITNAVTNGLACLFILYINYFGCRNCHILLRKFAKGMYVMSMSIIVIMFTRDRIEWPDFQIYSDIFVFLLFSIVKKDTRIGNSPSVRFNFIRRVCKFHEF